MLRTPLTPGPLVYAHRGDRSRAPDNTIEAYRLAVEAGTDGIELDVRRTRDDVLIMSHDDRHDGFPPICAMSFDEVRAELPHIPTLIEALEAIPQSVFVNVEIKNWPNEEGFDEARVIVDRTLGEIAALDTLDRILISSFDPEAMARAAQLAPEVLRGQLVVAPVDLATAVEIAVSQGSAAVHPPMEFFAEDPGAAMASIHNAGLAAVVWRVDHAAEVELLLDLGVDAMISDSPGMVRGIIDQR